MSVTNMVLYLCVIVHLNSNKHLTLAKFYVNIASPIGN